VEAAIVIAASEASPVVQAAAMLAIVTILGLSIAFLVRRSRARSRQERDRHAQMIARLPEEYRPQLEHRRLWIAAYVVASAGVALVGRLVSGEAAMVLAWVTFLPGTAVLVRKGAARNRRIIEAVRADAGHIDDEQLTRLVGSLQQVYGTDMKPLRTLLRAEPGTE
jgi:hypothetical protein